MVPRAMKKSEVPRTAVLKCHPDTSSEAVCGIEARLDRSDSGSLAVNYILTGEMARLRIPPGREPRRTDRLWERTCFEAFVRVTGTSEYCEFNFSPSGEWAIYAFRRYREGAPLLGEAPMPEITVQSDENSLTLNAIIRLDHLPLMQPGAALSLALSAVIEEHTGMFSYWALRHPTGKPDFHHPDSFALELEPVDLEGR